MSVNAGSKYDPLHHVGSRKAVNFRREHNVVRAMHLRPVIPGTRLPWEWQPLFLPAIFHFEETFRNIQIGRAVFPHRPELQQVRARPKVSNRKNQIERGGDVIRLHKGRVVDIRHREGSGGALPEVNNRVGLKLPEDLLNQSVVAQIAAPECQFPAIAVSVGLQALFY